jgi:Na+/melibiose symporter-like transporter
MSSLSIILIKAVGWRKTFSVLGALSFMLSAASLFFIKEPKRIIQKATEKKDGGSSGSGSQEEAKPNFKDLFKNPVNICVLVGTFFRNLAGSVNTYYVPVFFLQNFP